MTYTIAECIELLCLRSCPTLFVDTCSLLDILRAPYRQTKPGQAAGMTQAATMVLQAAMGGRVMVVIPPPVLDEFVGNQQNVRNECVAHLNQLDRSVRVARAIGANMGIAVPTLQIGTSDLREKLEKIATDILDIGIQIEQDNDTSLRALSRAMRNVPPARKGAFKDCVIYEHALSIIQGGRASGFSSALVFLTSNTQDFCAGESVACAAITKELTPLNAELVTSWGWAAHRLGLSSSGAAGSTP